MRTLKETLERMTELALTLAIQDLTSTGGVTPLVLVQEENRNIVQIELPAAIGLLMDSKAAKGMFFGALRQLVEARNLRALVFASETWIGYTTPKGAALSKRELLEMTQERAFQRAVDGGYCDRHEAISVVAQSPTIVLVTNQVFERDHEKRSIRFMQEKKCEEFDQSRFDGAMKMYGLPRERVN